MPALPDSSAKRILLINVPHPSIGSRIPHEHLPPLGLLCIGGPLIDAGHHVSLLDAELEPLSTEQIIEHVQQTRPDIVMFGHSGSSTAHPIIIELSESLKSALPELIIIYGGVHPTYFWQEILVCHPSIDYIVRGEGEATVTTLVNTLASDCNAAADQTKSALSLIPGIAYRDSKGHAIATTAAEMINDLDRYRIGWELIDFNHYSYWGGHKAVVVQFSRGCPHQCSYCGQRGFWTRWRHREPIKFAREIARLHREHGVVVFNFADENFSSSKRVWKTFLEALIAEKIQIRLVASMRAGDVVRDADILHLYKQAGFERFLLGMEHTDEATLKQIKKGSSRQDDQQAIQLLRQHRILSLATWVAGFDNESDRSMWQALRQLLIYDPDQIQMLYLTPHRWTAFGQSVATRKVIQPDLSRWDYKHQILDTPHLRPWRLFFWVKAIEVIMQSRPRALKRLLTYPDHKIREAMFWYYRIGRKVWFHEIAQFLLHDQRSRPQQSLQQYWGSHPVAAEVVLQPVKVITSQAPIRHRQSNIGNLHLDKTGS